MEIIISVIVGLLILFTTIFIIEINKKHEKIVILNSDKYNQLILINEKYEFCKNNKDCYEFNLKCNSKRQFDKLNLYEMLKSEIEGNLFLIRDAIISIENNKKMLELYNKEISNIKSTITQEKSKALKINYQTFITIEERLFNSNILKPKTMFEIRCCAYYISPHGRNRYSKENKFNYNHVMEAYKNVLDQIEYKKSKQYQIKIERAKVSDSLRYDVLKRDNFKCQICGATQKDGVTLQVDHIVPVSKGGTSVIENLRTLCSRCNIGKSNKV